MRDPLRELLDTQGFAVLDGGLATTLEQRGADLDDPLWSAKVLLESPQALVDVHREFLAAGADCIATATYQATLEGFARRGLDAAAGAALMLRSVTLACEARDAFLRDAPAGRRRPLVAASIGPYGAFLADGSEYRGDYGLDEAALHEFHRPRWEILAASDADLIACETIPSLPETHALLRLLEATPERSAWISFSCRDPRRLCDGSSLAEAVAACDARPNVAAVGVNCTAPATIDAFVRALRSFTRKPIAVYPNSGETWDPARRAWSGEPPEADWVERAAGWLRAGASIVGGCCRTGPGAIARLRRVLETARC